MFFILPVRAIHSRPDRAMAGVSVRANVFDLPPATTADHLLLFANCLATPGRARLPLCRRGLVLFY